MSSTNDITLPERANAVLEAFNAKGNGYYAYVYVGHILKIGTPDNPKGSFHMLPQSNIEDRAMRVIKIMQKEQGDKNEQD